jgi:4-hydroxybenzoate polyprenyltransferase
MKFFTEYIYPRLILDIVTFFIPLMALGVFVARISPLSIEAILGYIANFLMLAFAFVYNDVADAEGDKASEYQKLSFIQHMRMNLGLFEQESGKRRFKNPFSYGTVSLETGYSWLLSFIIISSVLSLIVGGILGVFVALSNIIIGLLYSGGYIRFKAYPIIDFLSHSYLLAGVQILYFMTYQTATISLWSILVLVGVMVYSIGGDLWNEYRDFEDDQKEGLRNTAAVLGKKRTKLFSKLLPLIGIAAVVAGIFGQLFIN